MKILIAAMLIVACSAQAQTVWRCGPEGRSYTATPCADGHPVVVADTRNAADVQAGREVAERERLLAEKLVKDREREQDQARLAQRSGPHPAKAKPVTKPPKAKAKTRRPAPGEDGIWRAVGPASRPARG
jgi:hypothetical protein